MNMSVCVCVCTWPLPLEVSESNDGFSGCYWVITSSGAGTDLMGITRVEMRKHASKEKVKLAGEGGALKRRKASENPLFTSAMVACELFLEQLVAQLKILI